MNVFNTVVFIIHFDKMSFLWYSITAKQQTISRNPDMYHLGGDTRLYQMCLERLFV